MPRYTSQNIRPLALLHDRLRGDACAQANQGAFIKTLLNDFCARALVPVHTRTLAYLLGCKTSDRTTSVHVTSAELKHFKRYVRRTRANSFGALVQSALAFYFFPDVYAKARGE